MRGRQQAQQAQKTSAKVVLWVALVLYVVTAVLQTIVVDTLRVHHALGRTQLLLPTLANTLGMMLCGLLVKDKHWSQDVEKLHKNKTLWGWIIAGACIDMLSGMLLTYGLLQTGGGIFIVLYNSVPAWTAILSFLFLGKKLSGLATFGVILVCTGLGVNVLGQNEAETVDDAKSMTSSVYFGSMVTLCGSGLHATMFILSEYVTTQNRTETSSPNKPMNGANRAVSLGPLQWCSMLGGLETVAMTSWVVISALREGFWETGVEKSLWLCRGGFIALITINLVHAASFFFLLSRWGGTSSALLKGLSTITVFVISAVLYCNTDKNQCITPLKAVSIFLVLSGGYVYKHHVRGRTDTSMPSAPTEVV